MKHANQEIPTFIRTQYEELSQDLQSTYLKWKMYRQLFENPENLDFLDNHAPSFFLAVQDSFITDLVVSISRFTDKTKGTLTLASMISQLKKSTYSSLGYDLEVRSQKISYANKKIESWRHSLIAHKQLRPERQAHGDLMWSEVDNVLREIADALNLVERYFCNSDIGYAEMITHGDATEVIRMMRFCAEHETEQIRQLRLQLENGT